MNFISQSYNSRPDPDLVQFTIKRFLGRGNARQPVFEDTCDRRVFLALIEEVVNRFHWLCHAYCLMDNHYHLVVETIEGNLSRGMRHLKGVYTEWHLHKN
ncbi:MAG: transposase [bacterium]